MSQITVRHDLVITDPDIAALGRRIAGELILAAQKAAAHVADPAAFPIGADAPAEHIFLDRLRALPEAKRQRAGANAVNFLRGPAAVRAPRVGDLADVDVTGAQAVHEAVRARPMPAVRLTADKIRGGFAAGNPAVKAKRRPVQPSDAGEWLELRLLNAVCIDETNGFLGSEAGSDNIDVAVIFMDAIQRTTKTPVHDLGSYGSDGAQMSPPGPRVLGGVDLRAGFYWPRTLTATVCLSERDNGGFPEWVMKVFEYAKSKATSAVATALGGIIGGILGAGIGALVGALVGWVIGELIGAIKEWWEDDTFEPANLTIEIPSADAQSSGQFQIRYMGHGGEYLLTVEFRRTAAPANEPAPALVTGELEDRLTDLCGVAGCLTTEVARPRKIRSPTGEITTLPVAQVPVETPLVFALGSADGTMMVKAIAGDTTPWISLGGAFHSGPAVVMTGPTRPVVFAVGTDDALYHKWRDSSSSPWSDWHSLGGTLTSSPAATMSGGRIVVAGRGADRALWHKWYDNGWSDWHSLGGEVTSSPAIVQAGNRLVVFCRGTDGAIWHKWHENGWSDWHSLGGKLSSGPAVMMSNEGRLVVYARGVDGAIWHKWYDNGWSDWHSLEGLSQSAPAAFMSRSKQGMVVCRGNDGAIYERHYANGWTPWASVGLP